MSGTLQVPVKACAFCAPGHQLAVGHPGDHTKPSPEARVHRIAPPRKCAYADCSVVVTEGPGEFLGYCDHHRITKLEQKVAHLSRLLSDGRIRVAFTVDED